MLGVPFDAQVSSGDHRYKRRQKTTSIIFSSKVQLLSIREMLAKRPSLLD